METKQFYENSIKANKKEIIFIRSHLLNQKGYNGRAKLASLHKTDKINYINLSMDTKVQSQYYSIKKSDAKMLYKNYVFHMTFFRSSCVQSLIEAYKNVNQTRTEE